MMSELPPRRASTPPGFWDARRVPPPARVPTFTPTYVPPPSRGWISWVCVTALAVLAVLVWSLGWYFELVRARDFQAFETGLARVCIENGGVYKLGECNVPEVRFEVIPFEALPAPANPPPGSNVIPMPKPRPWEYKL